VNGDWRAATGLEGVAAAGDFPQSLHYDLAVPTNGGQLHIHTTGKSLACLESQLYGQSLNRDLALYGLTDGATCLADQSHNPGAIDLVLTGPDFGTVGGIRTAHVTQVTGDGDGGNCSLTMAQQCVVNADCPMGETCVTTGGSYRLHYTIRKG
jgi:hypothetical protein